MGRLCPVPWDARPACDGCGRKMWQNPLGGWHCVEHGRRRGLNSGLVIALMIGLSIALFGLCVFAVSMRYLELLEQGW